MATNTNDDHTECCDGTSADTEPPDEEPDDRSTVRASIEYVKLVLETMIAVARLIKML
jgi:hypothetical protein